MTDNQPTPNTDLDLEKRIIGAPLAIADDTMGSNRWSIINEICYTPLMFYSRNAQFLYMIYDRLLADGQPITPESVMAKCGETDWKQLLKTCQRLKNMSDLGFLSDKRRQQMIHEPWKVHKDIHGDSVLDAIGNISELVAMASGEFYTDAGIKIGAERLRDLWQLRTQTNIFKDAQDEIAKPGTDRKEVSVKTISAINELESHCDPVRFAGSVIEDYLNDEDIHTPIVASWPIPYANSVMPIRTGRSYTIGALPSRGKTSVAVALCGQTMTDMKVGRGGILFFSLEMPQNEIIHLLLAQRLKIPMGDIEAKKIDEHQRAIVQTLADNMKEDLPLVVDDKKHTEESLLTTVRLHAVKYDLKMIIIDNLQIVQKSDKRIDNIEHLNQVTKMLKDISKELNIAVVTLCQLNRTSNKSGHKKDRSAQGDLEPRISDLKGSGQIEANSDGIMLLWMCGESEDAGMKEQEWIFAKNRQGPIRHVPVWFHAAKGQHFTAREEE